MKKKMVSLILMLCMVVSVTAVLPVTVSAATEGDYTYEIYTKASGDEAIITECNTSISGDITIPSTLGGYPVTIIDDNAFELCRRLTGVTIPEGVKSIADEAFYRCENLTSIILPDTLEDIGRFAFSGCKCLIDITIPDSVISIGKNAFYNCGNLTSIDVSKNNQYYSSLDGVLFDKDVKTLILYPSAKEDSEYTIPDSVISIDDGAFDVCESLTSISINKNNQYYASLDGVLFDKNVKTLIMYPTGKENSKYTIPNGVTSIGDDVFCFCTNLTSIVIPDSVKSIGNGAFWCCESLISITMPDSVKSIDEYAFYGCESLISITLPNGVTSICEGTFGDCYSLTSITIPDSVTVIDYGAFLNCESLTDVYYGGSKEDWKDIQILDDNEYLTYATIHYNNNDTDQTDEKQTISDVAITESSFTAILNIDEDIAEQSAVAIVAFYDKNRKMIQTNFTDISLQSDTVNINIPIENKSYDKCMFMLWESLQTMKPLCNSELIN